MSSKKYETAKHRRAAKAAARRKSQVALRGPTKRYGLSEAEIAEVRDVGDREVAREFEGLTIVEAMAKVEAEIAEKWPDLEDECKEDERKIVLRALIRRDAGEL